MSLDDVYNHFFFLKGISSKRVLHTERTCNTGTYYDDILRCGSYRKKFEWWTHQYELKGRERKRNIIISLCIYVEKASDDSMRRRDDVFQNIWLLHDGGCGRNGRHENGGGLIHQLLLLFLLKSFFTLLQFSPDVSAYLCYVYIMTGQLWCFATCSAKPAVIKDPLCYIFTFIYHCFLFLFSMPHSRWRWFSRERYIQEDNDKRISKGIGGKPVWV